MIKISVIIPTYKPKEYLWECLNSLYYQTISKEIFEIVLVLNGCCEPYNKSINNYINNHKDLNITYFQTDKKGVSNARNVAIEKSKGEYITFIDDDDFVSPNYLEELYKTAQPNIISLCRPLSFKDGDYNFYEYRITKTYNRYHHLDNVGINQVRSFFSGPVYKLINRNIIASHRFNIKLSNGEDTLFMFLISENINKCRFTNDNAIYYRRVRDESASHYKRSFKSRLKSNLVQLNEYLHIWIKNPFKYNFYFFISRCGGALIGVFRF